MTTTITTTIQQQQQKQKQKQEQQQKQPKQHFFPFFAVFFVYLNYETLVGHNFLPISVSPKKRAQKVVIFENPISCRKKVVSSLFKHYLLQEMHFYGFQNLELVTNYFLIFKK